MASTIFLTVQGQKSGTVRGDVTQKGREGQILVQSVAHAISSPRDPASGLPTGPRLHQPMVVTKEIDRSSAPLYQMLATAEKITQMTLRFWRPSLTGAEQNYYSVTLTNASIAGIRLDGIAEDISFVYEKIQWTFTEGGITSQDTWASPAA
jgi:type VI secretion system secreted protein Hcp